jgi:hypothetical protein
MYREMRFFQGMSMKALLEELRVRQSNKRAPGSLAVAELLPTFKG